MKCVSKFQQKLHCSDFVLWTSVCRKLCYLLESVTTSLQNYSDMWWLKSCGLCSKANQVEQFLQYLLRWVTQCLWKCKKIWVSLLQFESINSLKRRRRKEWNSIHLAHEHFQFRFRYMSHWLLTIHVVVSWVLAGDLHWCILGMMMSVL